MLCSSKRFNPPSSFPSRPNPAEPLFPQENPKPELIFHSRSSKAMPGTSPRLC